jgi:hypothetical protein
MTATTVERALTAQKLWGMVFPQCPAPEPRQFVVWSSRFPDPLMERALLKTSRKFSGQIPDPEPIHRYVTGLLLNLEREAKDVNL